MGFRNLDGNHDWTFGVGRNNYVSENQEVELNIKTRVLSFLGDCFFATGEGIDWWNLLDYNKQEEAENAVMSTIADTPDVVKINNVETSLNASRKMTFSYDIDSTYSSNFQNDIIPITYV